MIGGVVLAAGEGRRFGGGKLLAQLEGEPLLAHVLRAIAAVEEIDRVVVVLGAGADAIRSRIDLDGIDVVVCEDWREGISASLRAGVAELEDADAVLVVLGDQPLITPRVIAEIASHVDAAAPAVRATYGGHPGHPVLIKRGLFRAVRRLRGDTGARDLLAAAGALDVECGHLSPSEDVDTPADLEAVRRARRPGG